MHGKSSKSVSIALSALLYTQGLLGVAGVTLVALKDRIQTDPVFVMGTASLDAQIR